MNYAQTRKSGLNGILTQVARVNDDAAQRRASVALGVAFETVKVSSTSLQSFTEAALWQRCASDWSFKSPEASLGHHA